MMTTMLATFFEQRVVVVEYQRSILGWIIIGLGIAGIALPFIPGVVLIVLGLVILSSHYVWAQGALDWLRRKFPKTLQFADLQLASLRQRFTTR